MDGVGKIIKSVEESGLLIKRQWWRNQNESKEQEGKCLSTLIGTLDVSLLKNSLAGKQVKRPNYSNIPSWWVMRAGGGMIRAA